MHVSRNKIERAIEKRLTEAMNREKPPIGPELAQYLAEWGQWLGDRDGSCRSSDWHVLFLRWSLSIPQYVDLLNYKRFQDDKVTSRGSCWATIVFDIHLCLVLPRPSLNASTFP